MSTPERTEALEYARELISRAVRAGYEDREQIVEGALESITEGHDVPDAIELDRQIRAMVLDETDRLLADRATWTGPTDNERLATAFAALESAGIVAREHFSCCGNCGNAEIGDEVCEGKQARGYTFFHQQDTDSAVDGGDLMLAYGPFDETSHVGAIGNEVASALREAGPSVDWSGDPTKRIAVKMDWRRRDNAALEDMNRANE